MKSYLLSSIAMVMGIFLISQNSALAGDSTHGGVSVTVKGEKRFRDFVDKTNWFCYDGEDYASRFPHFKTIMQNIAKSDWLVANGYQHELDKLKFCETQAPLVRIPVEDRDGFGVYGSSTIQSQVAIRYGDKVYISVPELRQLPKIEQPYVLIHEITHSFISPDEELRNTKVRSFVAVVARLERENLSTKSFDLQLEVNGLQKIPYIGLYPTATEKKADFETLLSQTSSNSAKLAALLEICGGDQVLKKLRIDTCHKLSRSCGELDHLVVETYDDDLGYDVENFEAIRWVGLNYCGFHDIVKHPNARVNYCDAAERADYFFGGDTVILAFQSVVIDFIRTVHDDRIGRKMRCFNSEPDDADVATVTKLLKEESR